MLTQDFKFDRQNCRELLESPDTHGSVVLSILLAAYNEDMMALLSEYGGAPDQEIDVVDIYLNIKEDFRVVMPEELENKLNAIMTALASDLFYDDEVVFRSVCLALYDGDVGDMVNSILEDITVPEILWATYEVGLVRDDESEFSTKVQAVIDDIINEEAESNDGLESAEVIPYYVRFLEEMKQSMVDQFRKLGVSKDTLFQIE